MLYYARKDFQSAKAFYDSIEQGKTAYTVGCFAEQALSEKLTLRVGLNFSSNGFQTKRTQSRWGSQNNNGIFDPALQDPTLPAEFYLVSNHFYIETPIDFSYFIGKKHHFYLNLGVSPNFNIYNTSVTHSFYLDGHEDVISREDKQTPYQKVGFSFQLGLGYEVKVFNKIAFDIQPRFQYYASPLYQVHKVNRANTFLYNAGLQIGVKI